VRWIQLEDHERFSPGAIDVGARLGCDRIGLLSVYLHDADEEELLGGRERFEAFAYVPSFGELGFGNQERPCLMRTGDCLRVVEDRPLHAVANDHSLLWLFSHPAPAGTPAALECAHITEVDGPTGWVRSIGAHLNAAVARLDWLGLPPGRSVTASGPAAAEEVYVVVRGTGRLRADGDGASLAIGTVVRRAAGDDPVEFRAGDEQLELLAFGTATPVARRAPR
jgi:hypothetical protein